MVQEKIINDRAFKVEVLKRGSLVWKKKDPNNKARVTYKILYGGYHYLYQGDGFVSTLKKLIGDIPEFNFED